MGTSFTPHSLLVLVQVKPGQRQDQAQRADHIYHYDTRPLACPGCKLHN